MGSNVAILKYKVCSWCPDKDMKHPLYKIYKWFFGKWRSLRGLQDNILDYVFIFYSFWGYPLFFFLFEYDIYIRKNWYPCDLSEVNLWPLIRAQNSNSKYCIIYISKHSFWWVGMTSVLHFHFWRTSGMTFDLWSDVKFHIILLYHAYQNVGFSG